MPGSRDALTRLLPPQKNQKPASEPPFCPLTILAMNLHPVTTPTSPSLASPIFDASFDSIESRATYFTSPVVPTLETTTVTEVVLGYHRIEWLALLAHEFEHCTQDYKCTGKKTVKGPCKNDKAFKNKYGCQDE